VGALVLGGGVGALDGVALGVILLNHGQLVLGHAQRSPEEAFLADDQVADETGEKSGTDAVTPGLALLVERFGREDRVDGIAAAEDTGNPAHDADGMTRAASVVEAVSVLSENIDVAEPVLESAAGEVGGKLSQEELTEVGVLAFAKDLPEVLVRQGGVRGDLKLEEMVLRGVEVDGVDTRGTLAGVGENVVAGASDSEDDVLGANLENAFVNAGVFPGEGIDVFVIELSVFLELIIIVDPPVVVLVEEGREGKVGREVLHSGEECLGTDLGSRALNGTRKGISALVCGYQARRLGHEGVNPLNDFMGQARRGEGSFMHTEPDVVGDTTEGLIAAIDGQQGAELVLEVVATTRLEADTVNVEPSSPEAAGEEVDMAVHDTTGEVAEGEVSLGLGVEIDNAKDSARGEKARKGVDNGVVVGLRPESFC